MIYIAKPCKYRSLVNLVAHSYPTLPLTLTKLETGALPQPLGTPDTFLVRIANIYHDTAVR